MVKNAVVNSFVKTVNGISSNFLPALYRLIIINVDCYFRVLARFACMSLRSDQQVKRADCKNF